MSERGSPPRGRGKAGCCLTAGRCGGITPAWAGKRIAPLSVDDVFGDHPRVGGEKPPTDSAPPPGAGSPPRGRGKGGVACPCGQGVGITPAWAGKRAPYPASGGRGEDHPRVGGEKPSQYSGFACSPGSPPRGRGKAATFGGSWKRWRITPAWAGKRLKRSHRSGIFISGPIPFHSVLHRPAGSGGSRAGRDGSPAGQPQNAGPA